MKASQELLNDGESDVHASEPRHVSESLKDDASKKIEAKLKLLEDFVKTGNADFELPKKISANFFCDTLGVEKGIGRVSQSSKTYRQEKVKARVERAVSHAQDMLKASRKKTVKNDPVKALKATLEEQNVLIEKLTNELVEQRRRAEDFKRKNEVLKGRIESMKLSQKITSLPSARK